MPVARAYHERVLVRLLAGSVRCALVFCFLCCVLLFLSFFPFLCFLVPRVGWSRAPRSRRSIEHTHSRAAVGAQDHYENPRNVGSLDKKKKTVGTGTVGAPACGDVMKFQVEVDPATNKIVKAVFKTFGCGSAIASSSLATEWVVGKTLEEASSIKNSEIAKYLSLPPVKRHCSMLAEDGIKAAISDYQTKQTSAAVAGTA